MLFLRGGGGGGGGGCCMFYICTHLRSSVLAIFSEKHLSVSVFLTDRTKFVSKHMKGSKERSFIVTQTHSLQIFGVIPFVKLQNKI